MSDLDVLDFWRHAQRHPDSTALIDGQGVEWPAGRLLAETSRISHGLRRMGVRHADVVATVLPKCAELVALSLATSQIGAHLLTINPQLPLTEIEYLLCDSGARIAVLHRVVSQEASIELQRRVPIDYVMLGERTGIRTYAETFGDCPSTLPENRLAGTLLTYTSGTTGRPKGVLRHPGATPPEQLYRSRIEWLIREFAIEPGAGGVHLCTCPLYFAGPLLYALYALHMGHKVVLMPGWHPRLALGLIERHRVTTSFMVPFQFLSMLKLPDEERRRYSTASLRVVIHGSAPCPPEVKDRMLDWWGDVLYENYGSTEVGGTVATPADWRANRGSVGRAMWPSEAKILDAAGNEQPPGRVGKLYMRVSADNDFLYKGDLEKTRAARRGEFATVGDVGYVNEAGYLFLLDRESDMICCRGEHIYPAELEAALAPHPKVDDCAAYGVPHTEWGEEIRVTVQLPADLSPSAALGEELLAHLRSRVGTAKCPARIEFTPAIPRDAGGKLRRRHLRDAYLNSLSPTPASTAA